LKHSNGRALEFRPTRTSIGARQLGKDDYQYRSNRKQPFSFSRRLYKLRWRIEAAFNRLKDFRRIATRYDRLARNYLASFCLIAALVWWI
jgi:transposase